MAGLNLALGRSSVAKMAISWNNWLQTRPYPVFASLPLKSRMLNHQVEKRFRGRIQGVSEVFWGHLKVIITRSS